MATLEIAEINKISKSHNVADLLDSPPKPTMMNDDLPRDAPHGWKFLTVWPDNWTTGSISTSPGKVTS